ncbi:NAD(P)-binding domain-containing protein [Candidatus Berkelbacteria bacterium]|nr:NAD(P)-binding domain-containing protein [Candidatus Berkelbacteria bacterium]
MTQRAAIIGSGALGTAVASVLQARLINLAQWDLDSSRSRTHEHVADAVANADLVFLCVPTNSIESVADMIGPYLLENCLIISLSKGLDCGTARTVDELMQDHFPHHRTALLSGPMLAAELLAGQRGIGIVAANERLSYEQVQPFLEHTVLAIEYSSDVAGVAWCGVLKNIYAIGLGVAAGLSTGDNVRGWLITQALGEMRALLLALGGQAETADTVAGIGDLIATALSPSSRNYQFGQAIALGQRPMYQSEGARALLAAVRRIGGLKEYPLFEAIYGVIIEHHSASSIVDQLSPA